MLNINDSIVMHEKSAFAICGFSSAVADAPEYVKSRATNVLSSKGGEGAFREIADMILFTVGKSLVLVTAEGYSAVEEGICQ
jgi:3-deoxy-D-manno-octulosonate 8-phosphate phosphatase KdsC-like HAD superfamily phosphatase